MVNLQMAATMDSIPHCYVSNRVDKLQHNPEKFNESGSS